jgi:hypothetical protein
MDSEDCGTEVGGCLAEDAKVSPASATHKNAP